jgi:hypothetical protein
MKKFILILILVPSFAFAQGSNIELVESAVSAALAKFSEEENKKAVDAFNAVKSWVSGAQIKVKVYYNANANTIDYVCEMMNHGGTEMMMCSK